MGDREITLIAAGDVLISREDPKSALENVASVIRKADITFCQNEAVYTAHGKPRHPRHNTFSDPRNASPLASVFDVISVASNHALDGDTEAFLEMVDLFKKLGIAPVGGGRNIKEARTPVIIEKGGTKVAFLAYCSVLPRDYEATNERPGVAPIRVYTFYEQILYEQPGTPGRPLTFAYQEDVEAMIDDIQNAKRQADIVIASFHWGVHFTSVVLAMYESFVGHLAINAGADLILGHHQHLPKGIQVYKGKVIFHGMGHLTVDTNLNLRVGKYTPGEQALWSTYKFDPFEDMEWSLYPFPPESRKGILVKCIISDKQIKKVSFLPHLINKKAQPVLLEPKSQEFDDFVAYMKDITVRANLAPRFSAENGEVVVRT